MTLTPLVSVVLPSTGSPWLGEAISSVLAQTMTDFELIVVDSTAAGDLDLSAWSDHRIRVLKVPWSGVAAARNAGNSAARAPYIAVIDHDDRWLPAKLERQLPHLEASPEVGMCHTQYQGIDASGAVIGLGSASPTSATDLLLGQWFTVLHSSTLWRRSVIEQLGGYDTRFTLASDYDLFLKVLTASTVIFEPSVQVEYRLHDDNLSHCYKPQYSALLTAFRQNLPALASRAGHTYPTRRQRTILERSLRSAYFVPAWDATVAGVRARQLRSAVGHGLFAARLNPLLAGRLLAKWGWHRLADLPPGS